VLWSISREAIIWEQPQTDSSEVIFSPDGRLLAAGGGNRLIVVRSADDGTIRHQLISHRAPIRALSFSPDSATLATASLDGVIKLWHVPTGQEMFELRGMGGICHSLAFAEDGRNLLALVDAGPARAEILVYRAIESDLDE
jgi:WD40 repeat protein